MLKTTTKTKPKTKIKIKSITKSQKRTIITTTSQPKRSTSSTSLHIDKQQIRKLSTQTSTSKLSKTKVQLSIRSNIKRLSLKSSSSSSLSNSSTTTSTTTTTTTTKSFSTLPKQTSSSLSITTSQNRSFSINSDSNSMETIEQAFTTCFGYKSTLNFTTLKHDFCGLLQYLNHIFESNEFKTATTSDSSRFCKQQINSVLGQFPMYISQLPTAVNISGFSDFQTFDFYNPQDRPIGIPTFLHFDTPYTNQIFFTPQQTILLFGTLCGAINSYEQNINPKKRKFRLHDPDESLSELTSNIYQRLADELSMEKEQLITILAQCYSLVFNGKFGVRYDEPCNLIYTSPATGTSTLYPILSILFHQLNLPFAYVGHDDATTKLRSYEQPAGFYYAPSKSKQIKQIDAFPKIPESIGYDYSYGNSIFTIQDFDKATIILMDCPDKAYTYSNWNNLKYNIHQQFNLYEDIKPTVFSFGTAEQSFLGYRSKKQLHYLFQECVYPYYYSPSMFNFKLGITQLHLFRYFQHHTQQQLLSSLPQSNNEQEQQLTCKQEQQQQQQQQLTSEQQQLYFGQNLFELISNSQKEFEQLLQPLLSTVSTEELNSTTSSPTTSTETNNTSNIIEATTTTTTTRIAQINQLLQTQLINNPKYYQLFYDIVFHPITDILSAKVSTITTTTESPSFNTINTIDSKKILSTIINDINIHDNNNNDDDIINTNIPITTIATSSTTTQKVTKQTQSKSNAVVKTTTSKAKTTNNQTNVTNSNESLITVPCLYLIPKLPYNSTNTNFNNTKMIEQYWKQFQLQQQKQDQSSNKTQIQSDYEDQSSNNNQPSISSTLFSTIHNLWFDLSLFTLYSLPTHRFVSTLAARPIRQDGQHAHGIYPIEYNLSQISPTCGDSDFICLEGPKHLYQSKNLLPADQRWFRLPLYNRKAEEGLKEAYKGQYWEYGDYVTNHFRKTPESNWVNSIIAFSQHFDCYLPFNHFNTKPISDIISHNKQYGFQQPISSMIEQRKPDISSDDFEAMALHYAHDKFKDYPHLMFIPPEHYKYANIVFTQEKSMLFLRFGSKDLFSNTVIFAKSSVGLNYGFGEYTKNGIDIYQVDVVLEEGLNNEIQANDEQLISKVNYLLQPMFTSNKKSPQSFVTAVGKINYEPIDNVKY